MILRLTVKQLLARKRRLFSTAAAVVIGVAFLAGTLVLIDTVQTKLDGVLADANQGVDAVVRGPASIEIGFGEARPPLDASLVGRVAGIDGVRAAAPRVRGYAQVVDGTGKPVGDQAQGAPIIAENWVDDPALSPYRIAEGRPPRTASELAVDRATARAGRLHLGDVVTVLTKGEPVRLELVGIARFGRADSMGGVQTVLLDTETAQRMLGTPGHVDEVAAVARPGVSQTELAARLRAALGAGTAEVVTGKALVAEDQAALHRAFKPFNTFLLVFALVALFVGAFIINNTFSILVSQRGRETALLRALGASRRQVLASVVAEAVAVGAVASALGLVGGVALAKGLEALLDALGMDVPSGPTALGARTIVASFGVGLATTVVAALLPARRAAAVAPMAALRDLAVEAPAVSLQRLAVGSLGIAGGAAVVLTDLAAPSPVRVGIGAAVTFIGVAALAPVLVRPVVGVAGRPAGLVSGMAGRLARQNALRNPARTARTAAALMTGVGLVTFIAIFAASMKASTAGAVAEDFHGDFVVDSGSMDGLGGLSPQLAAGLRQVPGVRAVSETRIVAAKVGDDDAGVMNLWESATVAQVFGLGTVEGDVGHLGPDDLVVDRPYARSHHLQVGSHVPVGFVDGRRDFTVAAIVSHGATWLGHTWADLSAADRQLDYRVYVAGADRATVEHVAAPYPTATVLDRDGLVADVNAEVDKVLALVYAMLGLAVLIALLGIANTLALSVHERSRELGLLRAVGMDRRQVRTSVRWESVLIAGFGTFLGLTVGGFFGWAMVSALRDRGVDRLSVPPVTLSLVVVVALVSGVAATVLPARRAARLDVLAALAS